MNSVGLWLVKTQTVGSAVSSVTVSSAFSADYENYKIVYSGGVSSTAAAALTLKLGASVTGYYSILSYAAFSSFTVPLSAGDNNSGSWGYTGYTGSNYTSLTVDLIGPFLAKPTSYQNSSWVAPSASGTSSGFHNVATSYSSFIIAPVAGTLTGGTIAVYGYKGTV
jgi:hypothetical protein